MQIESSLHHYNMPKKYCRKSCKTTLTIVILLLTIVQNSSGQSYLSEQLSECINYAPLIIEGTVLGESFTYKGEMMLYKGRYVELNILFKGDIESKVIEVLTPGGEFGNYVESVSHGARVSTGLDDGGILFATPSIDTLIESRLGLPLYFATCNMIPTRPGANYTRFNVNTERDIYQYLEKLTGRKRKVLQTASVPQEFVKEFSIPIPRFPYRDTTVAIDFDFTSDREQPTTDVILNLIIGSANSVLYVDSIDFLLEYDTLVFGQELEGKARLTSRISTTQHTDFRGLQLNFSDVVPGVLRISGQRSGGDNSSNQIAQGGKRQHIGQLRLPIKQNGRVHIRIPSNSAFAWYRSRLDSSQLIEVPSVFGSVSLSQSIHSKYLTSAHIDTVFEIAPDTSGMRRFQLTGQLLSKASTVFVTAEQRPPNRYGGYAAIPREYVTYIDPQTLQFNLPDELYLNRVGVGNAPAVPRSGSLYTNLGMQKSGVSSNIITWKLD